MGLLALILPPIVAALAALAEKQFATPGAGAVKYEWVTAAVHDFLDILGERVTIPAWMAEVEPGIEKLLDDSIEAAVAKLNAPQAGVNAVAPAAVLPAKAP